MSDQFDVKVGDSYDTGRYTGMVSAITPTEITVTFYEDKNYSYHSWTETYSYEVARNGLEKSRRRKLEAEQKREAANNERKLRSKGVVVHRGVKNTIPCYKCDILLWYVRDEEWYETYRVELMFCPSCGGSLRK